MIEILITGYLVCSVAAYGMMVHLLEDTYPSVSRRDKVFNRSASVVVSLFGPAALCVVVHQQYAEGYRWGWRL